MSIYDYQIKQVGGEEISMNNYRGKVLLIVNTATGCGFTPQYEGLEHLYQKYRTQEFEILDFPCNQFGKEAPGTDQEITEFCQLRYHTTFQTFSKIHVNGAQESPLYTYLKKEQAGILGNKIKWNFTKFLVNREGKVIKRFSPTVKPQKIEEYIEKIL